jgi:biopolymer transport protein ExbD
MSIGHPKSETSEEPITGINVTPLVDVSLVLVIIFMAAAPFTVIAGIKVLESQTGIVTGKVSASDNVTVKIDINDKITVNDRPIASHSAQDLISAIGRALLKSKDRMVIVSADDKNKVGQVVNLLDSAKQAGALKVAIMKNDSSPAPIRGPKRGNRNRG